MFQNPANNLFISFAWITTNKHLLSREIISRRCLEKKTKCFKPGVLTVVSFNAGVNQSRTAWCTNIILLRIAIDSICHFISLVAFTSINIPLLSFQSFLIFTAGCHRLDYLSVTQNYKSLRFDPRSAIKINSLNIPSGKKVTVTTY